MLAFCVELCLLCLCIVCVCVLSFALFCSCLFVIVFFTDVFAGNVVIVVLCVVLKGLFGLVYVFLTVKAVFVVFLWTTIVIIMCFCVGCCLKCVCAGLFKCLCVLVLCLLCVSVVFFV